MRAYATPTVSTIMVLKLQKLINEPHFPTVEPLTHVSLTQFSYY